jgi:hypothetical protein
MACGAATMRAAVRHVVPQSTTRAKIQAMERLLKEKDAELSAARSR